MSGQKLTAGDTFPELVATSLSGETEDIGKPSDDAEWRMVVVYRGKHCPMCTKYLNKLEGYVEQLKAMGVDVVAVSADSEEQLREHSEKLEVSFPLYYGLTLEQLEALGLYISNPRSEQETDHRFPEPGMFVVNQDNKLHVVDISNNPFARPEIDTLLAGITFIKNPENNYPIRGTFSPDSL